VANQLGGVIGNLKETWEKLPKPAQFGVMGLGVLLLGFSAWLVVGSGGGPMDPLYDAPMEMADAARVREHLERANVPYRIENDGTIMVAKNKKLEVRMQLASEGLAPSGGTGFELFDEQRFGASDFEQRVNFQRALEGELARTIKTLSSVESTRVHLNLPRRSLFRADDTQPSASVVLKLRRGGGLGRKQVVGIQELVANSVERLTTDKVAVLDDRGQLLSQDQDDGGGALALDYQRRYEHRLEGRVEEILERAIGQEHAVVRVASEFDFTRTEETQESYDPDRSVVRSEQMSKERSGAGGEQAGGIPGTRSNLPGGAPPTKGRSSTASSRDSETRNYEVDKIVRHVLAPMARLKRQSVAVLIDGSWDTGEDGVRTFVPRTEEEITRLAALVKQSVGFDEERGDTVEVQSMQFIEPDALEEPIVGMIGGLPSYVVYIIVAIAVVLVGVLVLFAMRSMNKSKKTSDDQPALPRTVRELEAELESGAGGDLAALRAAGGGVVDGALPGRVTLEEVTEDSRAQALDMAARDSAAAARVLRSWISERPGASAG